jgi:hypothetical protein
MTSQGRRIAGCHLLLRGNRWMTISVNKVLGAKDRCSPGGAVISAYLSAVVEGDTIVGWIKKLSVLGSRGAAQWHTRPARPDSRETGVAS